MEGKKSIVLYTDLLATFEKLTDDEAGKLIKHLLRYVNDLNPESDRITEILFEPIKQQLKRDLEKWNGTKVSRSEAGKAGANKRWQNIANAKKDIAKIAVNVNVNDNVINNNPNGCFDFDGYCNYINKVFGREFKVVTDKVKRSIKARLKEGYTKQNIIDAITNAHKDDFHKDQNYKHCTLEYFSRSATIDRFSTLKSTIESKDPLVIEAQRQREMYGIQ